MTTTALSQSTKTKMAKLAERQAAGTFMKLCERFGLPVPLPEHRFHPVREWALDLAWPERKVGLEVQGGLFSGGRHTQGAALLKEYEKLNEAAALGWRIIFITPAKLHDYSTFRLLGRALGITVPELGAL